MYHKVDMTLFKLHLTFKILAYGLSETPKVPSSTTQSKRISQDLQQHHVFVVVVHEIRIAFIAI